MKKVLLTLIPLLLIFTAKAQLTDTARKSNEKVVTVNTDNAIFTAVEHVPEYPGGIEQFNRFLMRTVRYPAAARENNTQGRVIVQFVVEKDGALSQVKVIRGIGDGCDEEAVRVVKLSSPWKPGIQNGRPVRVQYSAPVSFTLAN